MVSRHLGTQTLWFRGAESPRIPGPLDPGFRQSAEPRHRGSDDPRLGEHPNADAHYRPVRTANGQWQYPNPKGYGNALTTLRRWQRAPSRRTPDSRGWWEAQGRIDRAHRRAKGLRDNAHHHISSALVEKYHTLGIETLNVAGMIRSGPQSKALADAGMSNLLRQVRYKAQWYGTHVVEAHQWYPRTSGRSGTRNGRPS